MRRTAIVGGVVAVISTAFSAHSLSRAASPAPDALARAAFNDNLEPAGTLRDGILELGLEVRPARWHLLGDGPDAGEVLAFAEPGRPPQIPGPLIRVPVGTAVRVVVENPLDAALVVHGLSARRQEPLDSLVVPPGGTAEARFVTDAAGTYYYWGTTTGVTLGRRGFEDSQLGGALIVDPTEGSPADRVLVIGEWIDGLLEDGSPDFGRIFAVINGRPWPYTERMTYALGDSIHWRVINLSSGPHPMHLHGFHFRVDARGDLARDTIFWPAEQRVAVTEPLWPGQTMTMAWSPDRPGGWLFHCHLSWHVAPNPRLGADRLSREERTHEVTVGHAFHDPHNHVETGMGGLMLLVRVPAPEGWELNEPAERRLRLFVQSDSLPGEPRHFGYVLQEDGREPAPDSVRLPGSTLVLRRGEPTAIQVINRSPEPTQIHWHGLEIQSYYDGVVGLGGHAGMHTPAILPGDSFEVRITPPRAGSFMYHTHMNDIRQQSHGLYGPLIVLEPEEPWDPGRDVVLLVGSEPGDSTLLLNGRSEHEPLELRVGESYRLRLMNITVGWPGLQMRLVHDGAPEQWRPRAKDGADLPEPRRRLGRAQQEVSIGETYDFVYDPRRPGDLLFEVRTRPGRLVASRPVRVLP